MKKFVAYLFNILILTASPSAFAGHDHGGGAHGPAGQTTAPGPVDERTAKATEQLLKSCEQHVESIQRHIARVQAQTSQKRTSSAINDELERLEQKLKEAKELVRSLQVF